ncbi:MULTISPECIES: hypothetical protein [Streptomyces]|uniref:Uncharacterized protein n=1 Tax=Streptomyces poriferorum TaxID=2798799 RepID=A0ABY9J456_9ACTN|nr:MULTISPECIES: hypothetical protein [unclassified Streptomyces]MDP5315669.1 hypothetical protein [Streptomyces sp. Alt4]WLQ61975.1 hypothetical protein P8A19_00550 [Streptomyces sp. Alt2]
MPARNPKGQSPGRPLLTAAVRDGAGTAVSFPPAAYTAVDCPAGVVQAEPEDVVAVPLPDSGRGYLSKIFNAEWMADYRDGCLLKEGARVRPGQRDAGLAQAGR